MKEFYIYSLKQSYIDEFSEIEPKLLESKGRTRPAICLKDSRGQNWLLPMTSLNPDNPNYFNKVQIINAQTAMEQNMDTKAIMRFDNLLGNSKNPDYEDVLTFYKAIPVKDKNVIPYQLRGKHKKTSLDDDALKAIKDNFISYMSRYYKGKWSGFLFEYAKRDRNAPDKYQVKAKAIKHELYKGYYAQLKKRKETIKLKGARLQDKEQRSALKKDYLELAKRLEAQGIRASPKDIETMLERVKAQREQERAADKSSPPASAQRNDGGEITQKRKTFDGGKDK